MQRFTRHGETSKPIDTMNSQPPGQHDAARNERRTQGRRSSGDRIDMQKERKAQKIKENLGKQEGPSHHVAPKITAMGNTDLRKKVSGW